MVGLLEVTLRVEAKVVTEAIAVPEAGHEILGVFSTLSVLLTD